MLKQRMYAAYRNVRLESLRAFKRVLELIAEVDKAYKEYVSLKKILRELKEEKSCVAQ